MVDDSPETCDAAFDADPSLNQQKQTEDAVIDELPGRSHNVDFCLECAETSQ